MICHDLHTGILEVVGVGGVGGSPLGVQHINAGNCGVTCIDQRDAIVVGIYLVVQRDDALGVLDGGQRIVFAILITKSPGRQEYDGRVGILLQQALGLLQR